MRIMDWSSDVCSSDLIDRHGRLRQWLALKLQVGLLLVVHVEVRSAQGVHEVARREIADLRHHHGQQSVGSDVEGHAEKDVGAALVELAGEPALGDVELEQAVAGRQRHAVDLRHVPGRHYEQSSEEHTSDLKSLQSLSYAVSSLN